MNCFQILPNCLTNMTNLRRLEINAMAILLNTQQSQQLAEWPKLATFPHRSKAEMEGGSAMNSNSGGASLGKVCSTSRACCCCCSNEGFWGARPRPSLLATRGSKPDTHTHTTYMVWTHVKHTSLFHYTRKLLHTITFQCAVEARTICGHIQSELPSIFAENYQNVNLACSKITKENYILLSISIYLGPNIYILLLSVSFKR